MSNRFLRVFVVIAFFAASVSVQASNKGPIQERRPVEHVPGELIVKFRDGEVSRSTQFSILKTLEKRLGLQAVQSFHPLVTDASLGVIKLKSDEMMADAISALKDEAAVLYSEPNYIYRTSEISTDAGVPNDPSFQKSWSLNNVGQADGGGQIGIAGDDINVMPLWLKGFTGSKNIVVAVIDTGIQWTHPDLAANLYTNPGEIAGNGKDDDKNGFVDDIHGWNFSANSKDSNDDNQHGSHCAGVIGASGNNGIGIAGVNWNVSLMPIKFLEADGSGTLENAVNSINYARMMKVNVMSNSWGGGGFSQALKDSIEAASKQGILFVAAAGNNGLTNDDAAKASYPASYDLPNIVAVGATDNKNSLASFSNYGAHSVHVAAPGVAIYSTIKGNGYANLSGTSMATPHVAGIAALLLSKNPTWTDLQIKDRLIKTSTPEKGLRRRIMSKGVVNAYNAFYGIIPPTDEPDESAWKNRTQVIETPHPYTSNLNLTFPVSVAGAKNLRIHFEKIGTEANYDLVTIERPNGEILETISGAQVDYTSDYITGGSVVIRFQSDTSVNGWGFKVDKIQYILGAP